MKYLRYIILAAIVLSATPALGQSRHRLPKLAAGLRLGTNIGSISLTDKAYDIYSSSPSAFAVAGAWFQYRTEVGISFRPELTYKGRGGTLTGNDVYYHLLTNTIDTRLCVQLDFYVARSFASFYLMAAPTYVHTLGGHVSYRDDLNGDLNLDLSANNISDDEFELFCGAGFEYPLFAGGTMMLLSLEAGYNFTLTNNFTAAERNGELNAINLTNLSQPSVGSRLLHGVELAVRVGIPFGHHMKIRR